jgi:hypothetical protein
MAKLLDRLPYLDREEVLSFPNGAAVIRPYQIVVWVSVLPLGAIPSPGHALVFPAILDTGNSYTFAVGEGHLQRWAGLASAALPFLGSLFVNNQPVERRAATVWLHRNRRGERKLPLTGFSYPLELDDGIAIYPRPMLPPRLPLLGLRALDENRLSFLLDGSHRFVDVRTQDWRARCWRWLG